MPAIFTGNNSVDQGNVYLYVMETAVDTTDNLSEMQSSQSNLGQTLSDAGTQMTDNGNIVITTLSNAITAYIATGKVDQNTLTGMMTNESVSNTLVTSQSSVNSTIQQGVSATATATAQTISQAIQSAGTTVTAYNNTANLLSQPM